MLTEDYIIRMIPDMVRLLSKILGKQYEQPYGTYEASEIKHSSGLGFPECLYQLADQGEIGRAEDMLFEELDFSDIENLSIALNFYTYLNTFSDDRLEACSFSRDEVLDGLRDCAEEFGVDTALLDAFHD